MDWLSTKLDNILTWLAALISNFFTSLINFIKDVFIWVFDSILGAVAFLLESIPVPDFMSGGLTGLFSALPSGLVFLLDATGMIAGLAIVGAGVAFNLTRKLFTLGQW